MYIQPNSTIRLLKNVPLDTTYQHSINFTSKSAQTSYFAGLAKYTLSNQSYQRVQKGEMRVNVAADSLYDCNYLMFQNTAFGSKWFYAFITGVEYVNNVTSSVMFEIDVLQTWHFDYTLMPCFIDRQHTTTDEVGDNITPEPVSPGEYVYNGYNYIADLKEQCILVQICDIDNGSWFTPDTISGENIDGVFVGAETWALQQDATQSIINLLAKYTGKPEAVIGIYTAPRALISDSENMPRRLTAENYTTYKQKFSLGTVNKYTAIDGYTPKNAKMQTYPFSYHHIDNGLGSGLTLRYEFYEDNTCRVEVTGTVLQPVQLALRPYAYKQKGTSSTTVDMPLMCESLSLANFPMCSWVNDSYAAWVAQNAVTSVVTSGIQIAAGAAITAASGGSAAMIGGGMIAGGLSTAAASAAQAYEKSVSADQTLGNPKSGNVNVAGGYQNFWYGRCTVNANDTRRIDDFFTIYGYAIGHMDTPNRGARPHWTYVKTSGCNINGSIPADDMSKICSIYDTGVTWWKNASEVGNYNLDNRV